jgi:hypothetical protein
VVSKRWGQNKSTGRGNTYGPSKQHGAADTRTLKFTAWGLIALGIVIVGVGMAMNTPAHEGATFGLLVIGGLVIFGGFLMHWLDRMDGGIAKEEAERPKRRHLLQHKRSRKRQRTAEDDYSVLEELDDLVDAAPAVSAATAAPAPVAAQPVTIAIKPPLPARIEPVLRATAPLEQPRTIAIQRQPLMAPAVTSAVASAFAPALATASARAATPASENSAPAPTPRAVIQAVDTQQRPTHREHSDLISAAIAKAEAARAQQLAQVAQAAEAEKLRQQTQAAYAARVAAEEEAARRSARELAQSAAKTAAQQAARAEAESKARFDDLPAQRLEDFEEAQAPFDLAQQSASDANEFRKGKGVFSRFTGRLADRFKRAPTATAEPPAQDEREDHDRWQDLPETATALNALREGEQQRWAPAASPATPVYWQAPVPTQAPLPLPPPPSPIMPTPPTPRPLPAYTAAPAPRIETETQTQAQTQAETGAETGADWTEDMLAATDWRSFENVVEALFRQAGFRSRILSLSEDGGADIGLFSRNQPGTPASVLHCHHGAGERIGVSRVRALRHVMSEHQVQRGQLVISGRFTSDAKAYAREHNIRLMDGPAMLGLIRQRSPEQQAVLLELLQEGLV